jgi:ParB-like chromosome segregation protein Spo0J
MDPPANWQNPITTPPGQVQRSVDPNELRPSRGDLIASRLKLQHQLLTSGQSRWILIMVSQDGVIIDGHHAVRAAAEQGQTIDVVVSNLPVPAQGLSILDLPIR